MVTQINCYPNKPATQSRSEIVFTETKSKGFFYNRVQRQPPSHLTLSVSCTDLVSETPDTPQGSPYPAPSHRPTLPGWTQNESTTHISSLGRSMGPVLAPQSKTGQISLLFILLENLQKKRNPKFRFLSVL